MLMMSPKITALVIQKRNPQRVNVFLDGEFAFGLSRITAAWLSVGQELSAQKIAELQAHDAEEVALQRALRFLSYRPRSEMEIRRNLEKHALSDDIITNVLERLKANGLVDDQLFARQWVENRNEFRPRGRRALVHELRARGLAPDVIDQALAETGSDEDALAYEAALHYTRKLRPLEWLEFRRKLASFLARRGFAYETANTAIRRVWLESAERANSTLLSKEDDEWTT
jgi:regulatory protein